MLFDILKKLMLVLHQEIFRILLQMSKTWWYKEVVTIGPCIKLCAMLDEQQVVPQLII
jgi:hypothetical protein